MITLPQSDVLLSIIEQSLNVVGDRRRILKNGDWFPEIAKEIAGNLRHIYPTIDCYARGYRRSDPAVNCKGSEWLFDFCALINDPDVIISERFMAQAAIVGEVEWDMGGIDHDFEKLMIADSLVYFYIWGAREDNAQEHIEHLSAATKRRRQYCEQRGMTRLPSFLLSYWLDSEEKFIHKHISDLPEKPGQQNVISS